MARTFNSGDLNCGTSATLQTTAMSLSIWFRPTATPASYDGLIGWETATASVQIMMKNTRAMAYYCYLSPSGSVFKDPGLGLVTLNTWNNVVLCYDSTGGLRTYLNSANDGTGAANGNLLTGQNATFGIGYDAGAAGRNFLGGLAVGAMWNVALTAAEAAALAQGVLPYNIRPKNLGGYWPIDGLQSPEPDLSGNANNGTINGSAAAITGPPVAMFTPRGAMNILPISAAPSAIFRRSASRIGTRTGTRQTWAA